MKHIPVRRIFLLMEAGAALSMLALSFLIFAMTGQGWVLAAGVLLTVCALAWLFLLTLFFAKRLSQFTSDLCRTMGSMITGGEEPARADNSETIFARISYRLSRLYGVLQENRRKVDEERRELQTLVSDISHQVKTPVANLKMVTDTLPLCWQSPSRSRNVRSFCRASAVRRTSWNFWCSPWGKPPAWKPGRLPWRRRTVRWLTRWPRP